MPFTAEQISYAGKSSMDYIIRQKPEDLYNTERPLLKNLRATKKTFPGAKQYINEKLRITNDSNFQWFGPDDQVTFNRKRTLEDANFPWSSCHDGFALTEEELLQNYISVTDNRNAAPTTDEVRQFVNLITENTETLKEGFAEKFDYELHLDGTQDVDAIVGLDGIISTTPTVGTLGGIDRSVAANQAFWSNHATLDVAEGALIETMEQRWRDCRRIGGNTPNLILCGSVFLDTYRRASKSEISREIRVMPRGGTGLDPSVEDLWFKGVPLTWDPVMDDLEADLGPTQEWDSRCYFLNTRFLKLRPAQGQDMVTRRPPRAYDRYTHYWGLTWRGGMCTNRPGSMAVITTTGAA